MATVDGSIGNLLSHAMVGLSPKKCVAWESDSCAKLFGESLLGKAIGDVVPALAGDLDAKQAVRVWCPGQPRTPFRAVPSRPSGKTFEWFVTFDKECGYRTAGALLQGANRERHRLAERLHEGPYQILTALLLQLGKLDATAHNTETDALRMLVDTASNNLRDITSALCPPRGPGGLRNRLTSLADVVELQLGIQLAVTANDDGQYPPDVEAAALEAVQAVLMFAWTATVVRAGLSLHASTSELRLLLELEGFAGPLSNCAERVRSQDFVKAGGVISADMESDVATIALRFPLATIRATNLS